MIKNLLHNGRVYLSKFRTVTTGKKRSGKWRSLEQSFIDENPFCEVCGSHINLQVHHIKPFHLYPELELDPSNLITLCMDTNECHLKIGHGGNWRNYFPDIVKYVKQIKNKEITIVGLYKIAKNNRIKD